MEHLKHKKRALLHLLSAPFIYPVFFAFLFLDIMVEIYHRTSFPLYWLPYVQRKKYIKFDRVHLPYLNILQKLNCLYCSYGNGLIAYVQEIVAQTEIYWCGIQHAPDENYIPLPHHKDFILYGDEQEFFNQFKKYRQKDCKLWKKD